MAWKPKPPCPICRRLGCQNPQHQKQPKQRGERKLARPEYNSSAQIRRRRETVAEWLSVHGIKLANGDLIARCPDCKQMRARFIADHITPIALGGSEDGPLTVHCASCSGKQGAAITNRRRPPLS